jgi:hypothetical protein
MTPYKMTEENDCVRTCNASMLDRPPATIPAFKGEGDDIRDGAAMWKRVNDYLLEHDLTTWFTFFDGGASLDEVCQAVSAHNPGRHYMLCGWAGYEDHAVVCCDDGIVHDPSRFSPGLIGPGSNGVWMVVTLISAGLLAKP